MQWFHISSSNLQASNHQSICTNKTLKDLRDMRLIVKGWTSQFLPPHRGRSPTLLDSWFLHVFICFCMDEMKACVSYMEWP